MPIVIADYSTAPTHMRVWVDGGYVAFIWGDTFKVQRPNYEVPLADPIMVTIYHKEAIVGFVHCHHVIYRETE